MGNKKKQTNEFDNYFDDDFEVVYEDLGGSWELFE